MTLLPPDKLLPGDMMQAYQAWMVYCCLLVFLPQHMYTTNIRYRSWMAVVRLCKEHGIPALIYYPVPMQEQIAFKDHVRHGGDLSVAKRLTQNVLSLPIHTEMEEDVQEYIVCKIKDFYV